MEGTLNTKETFDTLCSKVPLYYAPYRWNYIDAARGMLAGLGSAKVLEIGPAIYPICTDEVVIESNPASVKYLKANYPNLNVLERNVEQMPLPFTDKAFDVVVALQVMEHLKNPFATFQEMRRVSRRAIISIPFGWHSPSDESHALTTHHLQWFFGGKIPLSFVLVPPFHTPRLVMLFVL